MNELQRKLIEQLADAARELERDIRYVDAVAGECWVTADWIADRLEQLDMELAVQALEEARR